jgi:hypothetical protein
MPARLEGLAGIETIKIIESDSQMSNKNSKPTDQSTAAGVVPPIAQPESEIFADGVASVAMRAGVVKIDLYQALGPGADGQGEVRKLSTRVALPLSGLRELHDMVLQAMASLKQASENRQADATATATATKQ